MSDRTATGDSPRWGTVEQHFWCDPLDANGRPLHGGNHYANPRTLEECREYAHRILTADRFMPCCGQAKAVRIDGYPVKLKGSWVRLAGREADPYKGMFVSEVVTRDEIAS